MTSPDSLAAVAPDTRSGSRDMKSVLEQRWARLLIPSFSDLFFVAIVVWLFLSGSRGWDALLADADVGWHIRTGEYILDTGSVPYQDLYSFSKPGAPWFAWEWLTDVLDALLHRAAGLKGVVLMAGVIIAVFATTLFRRMAWHGTHLFIALLISLMAVGSASIHYLARPHVFTLLLLSIAVWMIESDRRRATAHIWWLVPMTLVWTNLHGGFLALIAVLGLTTVGTAIEAYLDGASAAATSSAEDSAQPVRSLGDALRYLKLTLACFAVTFVNPYGWNLHLHVAEYLQSPWIKDVVEEFQSPKFRGENLLQFEAVMLCGLIVAGALFRTRRIVEGLWIVFWAHMALTSVRHVPVFVTVAAPLIAAQLSGWWHQWTAPMGKNSVPGILNQMSADLLTGLRRTSLVPYALVGALIVLGSPPVHWPQDFPDLVFPTRMVHQHEDLIFGARVLTTDQWADYLIYTDPEQKVFVDGRSDFYGPEVGNEFLGLTSGGPEWREVMDKYQFDVTLLPSSTAIVQLLKLQPEWRLVASDDQASLLVRTSPTLLEARETPTEPRF